MMNEWRRRNRTPDTAIRQSGDRARTQAQVIKNYNTQTAYESLEDRGPKKGSYFLGRGRDWRPGTVARKKKLNIRSEDREKMVWNVVLTRSTHLPFFVCVCVCLAGPPLNACVCVYFYEFKIQDHLRARSRPTRAAAIWLRIDMKEKSSVR